MNNYLTIEPKKLKVQLSHRTPVQSLVFGSLCTERILPLINLWNPEIFLVAREALNTCWQITAANQLPLVKPLSMTETLKEACNQLILKKKTHFEHEATFAVQSLMAIVSLIEYCQTLDVNWIVTATSRSYEVVMEFERISTVANGNTYHQQFRSSDIESFTSVQDELERQLSDLSILQGDTIDWETIATLRKAYQNQGDELLSIVHHFIENEHQLWERIKRQYPPGQSITGVIEDLLLDGVVVNISHRTYAVALSNELGMKGLGLRKIVGYSILGKVREYDEGRRLLILESVKISEKLD